MANVQYTENLTEEQLDAMAGSETLRYQATSFGVTRNNKVCWISGLNFNLWCFRKELSLSSYALVALLCFWLLCQDWKLVLVTVPSYKILVKYEFKILSIYGNPKGIL